MAASIKLTMMLVLMALIANCVAAADPDPLQDVCPADLNSDIIVNGYPCKPTFDASDFTYDGLAQPGNTNNIFGTAVTRADVQFVPGLNTLGLSMARVDFAPGGLNPPHHHPRATEMIFVLFGQLYTAFITTNNTLVSTFIKQGEVYVFPRALIHFQKNYGNFPAAILATFNSQNPGAQVEALSLFNSTPPVPDDVLAQYFQISPNLVEDIRSAFREERLDNIFNRERDSRRIG